MVWLFDVFRFVRGGVGESNRWQIEIIQMSISLTSMTNKRHVSKLALATLALTPANWQRQRLTICSRVLPMISIAQQSSFWRRIENATGG